MNGIFGSLDTHLCEQIAVLNVPAFRLDRIHRLSDLDWELDSVNLQVRRFGWISENLRSFTAKQTKWIGSARKTQMKSVMITFPVILKIFGALCRSWHRLAAPVGKGKEFC